MDRKTIDLRKLSKSSVDRTVQTILANAEETAWAVRLAAGRKSGFKNRLPES